MSCSSLTWMVFKVEKCLQNEQECNTLCYRTIQAPALAVNDLYKKFATVVLRFFDQWRSRGFPFGELKGDQGSLREDINIQLDDIITLTELFYSCAGLRKFSQTCPYRGTLHVQTQCLAFLKLLILLSAVVECSNSTTSCAVKCWESPLNRDYCLSHRLPAYFEKHWIKSTGDLFKLILNLIAVQLLANITMQCVDHIRKHYRGWWASINPTLQLWMENWLKSFSRLWDTNTSAGAVHGVAQHWFRVAHAPLCPPVDTLFVLSKPTIHFYSFPALTYDIFYMRLRGLRERLSSRTIKDRVQLQLGILGKWRKTLHFYGCICRTPLFASWKELFVSKIK